MQAVLNFGKNEKERVKGVLCGFEEKPTTADFEEFRCKSGKSTLTLYSTGKLSIQGDDAEKVKKEVIAKMGLGEELMLGIDETGRGENNGAFVVAGVIADKNKMRELRDSKKIKGLEEKKCVVEKEMLGAITISINAEFIDRLRGRGLTINQIEEGAIDSIAGFAKSLEETRVIVDGNPMKVKDKKIEFLPKADDSEPVVGAASVIAKYARENSCDKKKRTSWKTKAGLF
jgi:ribonuclease HII